MQSPVTIIPFEPDYAPAFKSLNVEWLEKYFAVEPEDIPYLEDPQKYIIDKGGFIVFAKYKEEIVGCCGLAHEGNDIYELIKMGVTSKYQGLGIGKKLGQAIINKARDVQARELYLITESSLKTAIHLYEKLGFVRVPVTERDTSRYKRCDYRMVYPPELLTSTNPPSL